MAWLRCCVAFSIVCIGLGGCEGHSRKKPDPTKGVVTGIVLCADTGKPARLAVVTLTAAPDENETFKQDDPLPVSERVDTDLEGKFRMEAVEPGDYYAFATLDGYLDPKFGIDFARIEDLTNDRERILEAQRQWKQQLVPVTVSARRASEITIQITRAAEIDGTVHYDDGSPAIGLNFLLFRKTPEDRWTGVGTSLFSRPAVPVFSDSYGHYHITSLPAGEYIVCTTVPDYSSEVGLRVCLGGTFRTRNAKTLTVGAGEIVRDADITVPLTGVFAVAGTVTAISDGHPLRSGTVRLLFADDKEKALECVLNSDGSFEFPYVPQDKYILQVTGVEEKEQRAEDSAESESDPKKTHHYADKEIPLTVHSDMKYVDVGLSEVSSKKTETK
jgi:hypothetical protein